MLYCLAKMNYDNYQDLFIPLWVQKTNGHAAPSKGISVLTSLALACQGDRAERLPPGSASKCFDMIQLPLAARFGLVVWRLTVVLESGVQTCGTPQTSTPNRQLTKEHPIMKPKHKTLN